MKNFLIVVLALFSILACSIPKKFSGQQGISGQVVWLEGNLMPAIGDTAYQKRATGKPIQRTLYIYEPTSQDEAQLTNQGSLYAHVNSVVIKKIETQKDGTFSVSLNPGKYSIFVEEDEGLFANVFDGEGIINPVTVEAGKFTDIQIKVNYKAFY